MNNLRLGLIGLGGMAPVHIEQIGRVDGAAVTSICDRDAGKVAEWGKRLHIAEKGRYTDYERLIADPDVDAVISVTPNDVHYDIVRLCLRHGKPVLAEKPFTRTFAEAAALLRTYREQANPPACMVGFSYRYVPSFRMAREMIREGKIGTVRHAAIHYFQEWGVPLFGTPMNWRWDPAVTGTGVLADLGSHMIDAARFLIGEPLEVSALLRSLIKERKTADGAVVNVDIDDFAAFVAVLEGGAAAVFQTSRNAYGCGNQLEISVYGDLGSLHMGCEYGDVLTWVHENEAGCKVREKIYVPDRFRLVQMQDFVDLARGIRREETPTLFDGYLNQRALAAVVRAHETRRTVAVEEIEAEAEQAIAALETATGQ